MTIAGALSALWSIRRLVFRKSASSYVSLRIVDREARAGLVALACDNDQQAVSSWDNEGGANIPATD